ncbi:MAG: methyltransferase domain-containing protein [Planctomycetaceae bacterium]|nr:methyltransferase domain-containing protein [Planctomycetaceae bacterium]
MTRLTDQAHELISTVLRPGETAIDATAGNGHDSCFLCQTVGPTGRVYAIDIQETALKQTADLLAEANCFQCELICCDHSQLHEIIPSECLNATGAIMFNLGYLPGGDHNLITQRTSTLTALETAKDFLRPGGMMTILAYPGHPGGDEEAVAIDQWLNQLSASAYQTETILARSNSATAPCLFVVRKLEP